jgi:hypothetical protein
MLAWLSVSSIARDCGCTCGDAPLSKNVIAPFGCWRASCCHAVAAPGPSLKLLRLPPSSQRTCPVFDSTSYAAHVLRELTSRSPSCSTSTELMWN